jgi:hypothetical protein
VVKQNKTQKHETITAEERTFSIDFHHYHPRTLQENDLVVDVIKQAWEMGEVSVVLIHGHGQRRAANRPFANTNTGYLGLTIRGILRGDERLRQWMYAKIDVTHDGSTKIRLRKNNQPTRREFDSHAWPDRNSRG